MAQLLGSSFPLTGPGDVPPPEPGPLFVDVDPPPPEKDFIEAVWNYMPAILRTSREYIKGYEGKWDKWLRLWKDEIDLQEWRTWPSHGVTSDDNTRVDTTNDKVSTDDVWESNYVHAPGYMIDQYVDRAYPQIFDGPEFFTVLSEDVTQIDPQDPYPANKKVQQYLLRMLLQGKIHARVYEILLLWPLIGTSFAKVFWYEHTTPKWQQSTETGKIYESDEVVYECPIPQVIPPDRILVDPKALHNDVQRHRFIGHRVDRTYEQVLEGFENGLYNLNRKEFEKRFESVGYREDEQATIVQEPQNDIDPPDKTRWVELWEWHGKVPYKGRLRESWGVIAVVPGSDDPEGGLQIRLSQAPLLRSGLRPFACAHFGQYPGPLGLSMYDRNEKLLYTISQLVAQMEDNVRQTANCGYVMSPAMQQQLQEQGNKIRPGVIITKRLGEESPEPLKMPEFHSADISSFIQYLSGLLQQRTTVNDTWQGLSSGGKTATEATILQQQGQTPSTTKTDLFTRDCFEPLLNLCLAYAQQLAFDDKQIAIIGADGSPQQVTITTEELKNGRYSIVATLTKRDAMSISRAQSIERILPVLQQMEMALANEGAQVSYTEIIRRYVDLIGVDGADRIVKILSTREQAMQAQIQDLMMRLEALQSQVPPPNGGGNNGNGNPPSPEPSAPPPNPEMVPGAQGGPMGPMPTDMNQLAMELQMQGADGNQEFQ